jgi:hypothetical protein
LNRSEGASVRNSLRHFISTSPYLFNSLGSKTRPSGLHPNSGQYLFQLAITGLKWCDLVLWSPVGKPNVERIRRDDQLITNMMSNVTSLWIRVIAPEIFEMRVPRKLYPVILNYNAYLKKKNSMFIFVFMSIESMKI